MKLFVPFFAALCLLRTDAVAQESDPGKAAEVAYEYLHSPDRDKEIEWLKQGVLSTPNDADEASLDTVRRQLSADFESVLEQRRDLTRLIDDPGFFDLQGITSKSIATLRYETLERYISLTKKNTLESWQRTIKERLARCEASEEGKLRFLQNFMSGMERSFTERLQAMGYSDKTTFDRDAERSERELVSWQEIFKMLQDTYGRWHIESATKDVVFESEVETAQFKMLLSRVTAR